MNKYYMGNNSGKQQSYQQYYESVNSDVGDIDLYSLDPYKVLNLKKNCTWDQLKSAYKDVAIKTHPDKPGGNKQIFEFVTTCFQTVAEEYKARVSNKSHLDLKKESDFYFQKMVNMDAPHPSQDFKEPFVKRFNKAFDECRYHDDEIEYGYGDVMVSSSKGREDIPITNVLSNKVDNETFNEIFNKKVPFTKEVVKYKEPQALSMAQKLNFTEIGSKRPDNYSSGVEQKSLPYTDYMVAYNGQRLADPEDIKKFKEFKSVKEYQKYRDSKAKQGLTSREKKYIEQQKDEDDNREFERQERIRLQNIAIQQAHEKANRLLIR